MGVEQSNSSLVFDDQLVLKVFRKVEPGLNPELEMLRFLTAQRSPNIAPLYGWAATRAGRSGDARRRPAPFSPTGTGGWELALDEIRPTPDASWEPAWAPRRGDRADAHRARLGR